MSVTIITDADIPVITRTGNLPSSVAPTPLTDNGTGMGISIIENRSYLASGPGVGPVTTDVGMGLFSGAYQVGGTVDFAGLPSPIPDSARITKIEITAQAEYHVSTSTTASVDNFPTGETSGFAKANADLEITVPNTAFTPNTTVNISATSTDNQLTPGAGFTASADVVNAGLIMTKVWDIANDPGQYPLGYITQPELLAQFDDQLLIASPGQSLVCFSRFILGGSTLNYNQSANWLLRLVVNNWTMTVTWEEPVSWSMSNPSPVEEGDVIEVTSDPLDPDPLDGTQIDSLTLEWTDSNGNPHSITVPPILWITITINLFRFRLPALTGLPQIFRVVITSTQFSGSVTLGKLATIFLVNATGIYTLVPGKTNDTLYDNDNGGDPVDVAIPNPQADMGFIGG